MVRRRWFVLPGWNRVILEIALGDIPQIKAMWMGCKPREFSAISENSENG